MFPNSAKASLFASGRTRLGLTLALALSMILPAIFSYSTAQAGTVSGEFCIEGIVIDWEEQPMGGLYVYLDGPVSQETQSAGEEDDDFADDNDDLDEGEFKFPVEDGDDLEPGTYVLSIELPDYGIWEGVTDTEFEVTLDANQDDCAQVRFKLRQLVEVNVLKINEDHEGLEDWVIEARPGPGNFFAEVQEETTDVDGYAYFELTPGNWIFVESAPMPENGEMKAMFTPVAPPQGKMELDVQPGEPYTIRFKNRMEKDGCLLVEKVDDQGYGLAGWGIEVQRADGSIAAKGMTDAEGFVKFDNLPRGPYTVVEEERAGWESEIGTAIDVNVEGNGCQATEDGSLEPDVTFMNVQTMYGFCVEGYKIDANGGVGIAGWEITVDPLDEGGYELENDTLYTDGVGKYRFELPLDDYRIPGSQYEICEEERDGWVAKSPVCRTVTIPHQPSAQCVMVNDFVNMQVGHDKAGEKWGMEGGKEMGGMSMSGPGMQGGMSGPGMQGGMSMEGPKEPMHCTTYHMVQKGEGLFEIGRDYMVSPQAMVDANPWVRDQENYWLYAGQKVCIP